MNQVQSLKKLNSYLQEKQDELVGIMNNTPPQASAENLSTWKEWQSNTQNLLLAMAKQAPDALANKLKAAGVKEATKTSAENVNKVAQKFSFALEKLRSEIKLSIQEYNFSPPVSETIIEIAPGITTNPSFRSIKNGEALFSLTANEAKVIKYLLKLRKQGHPDASHEEVIKNVTGITTSYDRVRDIFQSKISKLAYKALIKRGRTKGTVCLNIS